MKKVHVVGAVMVNERQEVLCALRSARMSLAGLWEFPGGKIEAGETAREALIREIDEEFGCTIEVADFICTCTHQYPEVRVRLDTYFARIVDGTPVAREHERFAWVHPQDLGKLNWAPADWQTVDTLMNR